MTSVLVQYIDCFRIQNNYGYSMPQSERKRMRKIQKYSFS